MDHDADGPTGLNTHLIGIDAGLMRGQKRTFQISP